VQQCIRLRSLLAPLGYYSYTIVLVISPPDTPAKSSWDSKNHPILWHKYMRKIVFFNSSSSAPTPWTPQGGGLALPTGFWVTATWERGVRHLFRREEVPFFFTYDFSAPCTVPRQFCILVRMQKSSRPDMAGRLLPI